MKIKATLTILVIFIALGITVTPQETVSRAHPSDVASPSFTPTKADRRSDESASAANASSPEDVTDRIIIRYRQTTGGLFSPAQDEQMQRLSRHAGATLTYLREMSGDAHVIHLPQKLPLEQVEQIAKQLTDLPEVEYAEPDRIVRHTLTPNDPRYGDQWHYYESTGGINAPAAWDITTGSNAIVVAILDTGVTDHPDLTRSVPGLGYDFVSEDISNDGDGRDSDPRDPGDWCGSGSSSWHGTHVAGTIGAVSNNGVGVAGVNWTSPLLHVRVLGACWGYSSDIIDGMRWAAGLAVPGVPTNTYPARVLNLSLGGSGQCPSNWQSAINDVTAQGAVVVVAAGNANTDAKDYTPAGCDGVITVAATDRNGSRAEFSNFGTAVEISAPGVNVLSTWNTGTTTPGAATYARMSGTSMAAPHVSGVVSLMLSRNPSLTPAQVLAILQQTARRFPSGSTCTTSLCGSGIVDAAAAVRAAGDAISTPTPTPSRTPSPTPSRTPSPTPSRTPSPTPSRTPSPSPSITPTRPPEPPITLPYRVFQFAIGAQEPVGQFNLPRGVAVAPDGTVYVADTDNHRIQRFSASGAFLGAWGAQGSSEGQFSFPSSVAVAPDGTVYVADSGNHRIQRFSATGAFLGAWGTGGSGDGQFWLPYGVAVAPDGTVYVADTDNNRIQRFSATGTFLGTWGSYGIGDGQFRSPSGVAVASDGTVYVADTENHRIQRFSANGAFLGAWGSHGSGNGQFRFPGGVAVAPDGTVYVANRNYDVQRFSATGAFLGKWSGTGDGNLSRIRGVAVAPDGTVYVVDGDNHVVQRFSATGTFLDAWGAYSIGDGQFYWPGGVAVATDGTVYVADTYNHRIQRFSATGTFRSAWGSWGFDDGQFYWPDGVAVATDGTVYVADTENSRIQRFSATGIFLGTWGVPGSGDGQFSSPSAVAVAPDSTVYVADTRNHRIQRFSASGTFLGTWGSRGSGDGQFERPSGVAVAPDGTVYVADRNNQRIQRFSATGTFLGKWGAWGSGDGQFSNPYDVAVAPDGTVYVADSFRIQHFSATGAFLGAWGAWGGGDGQFERPSGVAVAPDGRVYVADTYNNRIQVFGTDYPHAWRGEFFANDWLAGPVSHVENVPDLFLNRSWSGQPAANIPADHFTSRWLRYVNFLTGGRYRFTIRADDGVRFWIDDRLVVESWQPQSLTREVTVELSAGYHRLLIEHWDRDGVATLALEWRRIDNAIPTPTATPSPPPNEQVYLPLVVR
jgi:tripartite motif-containing protein 71